MLNTTETSCHRRVRAVVSALDFVDCDCDCGEVDAPKPATTATLTLLPATPPVGNEICICFVVLVPQSHDASAEPSCSVTVADFRVCDGSDTVNCQVFSCRTSESALLDCTVMLVPQAEDEGTDTCPPFVAQKTIIEVEVDGSNTAEMFSSFCSSWRLVDCIFDANEELSVAGNIV